MSYEGQPAMPCEAFWLARAFGGALRNPVEAAEPRSARREWPFEEGTGRGIAPSALSAQGRAVSAAPRTRAGGDASEIECSSFDFRQARNPWGEFLSVLSDRKSVV